MRVVCVWVVWVCVIVMTVFGEFVSYSWWCSLLLVGPGFGVVACRLDAGLVCWTVSGGAPVDLRRSGG